MTICFLNLCCSDKDYQTGEAKLHIEQSNDLHKVLSYLDSKIPNNFI